MVLHRAALVLLATAAAVLGGASGAIAQPSYIAATFNAAPGDPHLAVPSMPTSVFTQTSADAAAVGDVDADGLEDAAIVVNTSDPSLRSTVWVAFAPAALPSSTVTGTAPARGFRIVGPGSGAFEAGPAGLGDVNGDGLGEVVVRVDTGVAVVFGRRDGATVDLDHLGDAGFWIRGVPASCSCASTGGSLTIFVRTVVAAGDQNGDGRPDVAFTTDLGADVVYTPAHPAGAEIDDQTLGDGGFHLVAGVPAAESVAAPSWISIDRLGDLDGDGRLDLMVAWNQSRPGEWNTYDSHVAGVISPAPGATVDVRRVAQDHTGFLLDAADAMLTNAVVLGDQNGDGRRDFALQLQRPFTRQPQDITTALIAYGAPLGGTGTLDPIAPAAGFTMLNTGYGDLQNVGDQDGDGLDDVGTQHVVRQSRTGDIVGFPSPVVDDWGNTVVTDGWQFIVGSIADRNGDGRPEVLALHPNPWPVLIPQLGSTSGDYELETYLSGTPTVMVMPLYPPPIHTIVSPPLPGMPGDTYPTAPPVVRASPPVPVTHTKRGTAHADHLTGTPHTDLLRGLGGKDLLRGLGGTDRLEGGVGADRIVGGPGRDMVIGGDGNDDIDVKDGQVDTVRCGAGRDRVRADRRDRLSGCERVRH
jgi:Ca2+-binding RTX toxin-like protein